MTEKIMKQYGKIDILVNNAGISKEMPFLDMPVEVFDEICETNLRSVMLMMKAVLPYMKEQKSGNVVNIGSGAAIRGLPGSAAYSVSKAGVICLTQWEMRYGHLGSGSMPYVRDLLTRSYSRNQKEEIIFFQLAETYLNRKQQPTVWPFWLQICRRG